MISSTQKHLAFALHPVSDCERNQTTRALSCNWESRISSEERKKYSKGKNRSTRHLQRINVIKSFVTSNCRRQTFQRVLLVCFSFFARFLSSPCTSNKPPLKGNKTSKLSVETFITGPFKNTFFKKLYNLYILRLKFHSSVDYSIKPLGSYSYFNISKELFQFLNSQHLR